MIAHASERSISKMVVERRACRLQACACVVCAAILFCQLDAKENLENLANCPSYIVFFVTIQKVILYTYTYPYFFLCRFSYIVATTVISTAIPGTWYAYRQTTRPCSLEPTRPNGNRLRRALSVRRYDMYHWSPDTALIAVICCFGVRLFLSRYGRCRRLLNETLHS